MVGKCRTLFQSHWCSGTTCAKRFALWAQKNICGVDTDGCYLNLTQPHKNSKKELLQQCQAWFGEEFAEACRQAAEESNQKPDDAGMPDGLVSALLENMEPSDKQEFQDLEKSVMRQEERALQQRWQHMWAEKLAEEKASWRLLQTELLFYRVLNCLLNCECRLSPQLSPQLSSQ